MKKIINKILVGLGICVISLVLLGTYLNLTSKTYAQSELSKLTINLATQKNTYVQLEPIQFNLTLRNETDRSIEWKGLLMIGSDIDFLIKSVSGNEIRVEGRKMFFGSVISIPSILERGAETESVISIENPEQLEKLFPERGTYQVRVEFKYQKITSENSVQQTILSNPVTITVNTPQGLDLGAYDYIKNTLEPARGGRVTANELRNLQENFIRMFGSSIYAKSEILRLAYSYYHTGENIKALKEFCKVSSDENLYYSKKAQRVVGLLDRKLRPPDLTPLPPDAPIPTQELPCVWVQRQGG